LIIRKAKAFHSDFNENGGSEIYMVFTDGQMLKVWTLTLLWKLADSAVSEMFDSDRPTCSKTFIFFWIMGLQANTNDQWHHVHWN